MEERRFRHVVRIQGPAARPSFSRVAGLVALAAGAIGARAVWACSGNQLKKFTYPSEKDKLFFFFTVGHSCVSSTEKVCVGRNELQFQKTIIRSLWKKT